MPLLDIEEDDHLLDLEDKVVIAQGATKDLLIGLERTSLAEGGVNGTDERDRRPDCLGS